MTKIIYKKTLKDGSFLYSVLRERMDANQIDKKKAEFESRTTSSIIKGGQLDDTIEIPQDLRYALRWSMPLAQILILLQRRISTMQPTIIAISILLHAFQRQLARVWQW